MTLRTIGGLGTLVTRTYAGVINRSRATAVQLQPWLSSVLHRYSIAVHALPVEKLDISEDRKSVV